MALQATVARSLIAKLMPAAAKASAVARGSGVVLSNEGAAATALFSTGNVLASSSHLKPTRLDELDKYKTQSVRGDRPLKRFGYEKGILDIGFLPRLPDDPKPVHSMPVYKPKNAWAEKRALFGQNDYIDILGDGRMRPTDSMRGVPTWLRGFQGNEYQMLLLKRQQFAHWKVLRPQRYHEIDRRIRFLWRRLNQKSPT